MKAISLPSQSQTGLSEAQAELTALPGSTNNMLMENVWRFTYPNGREMLVNFHSLNTLYEDYPMWATECGVDLIYVAKLLWLSHAESTTVQNYSAKLSGIALFLTSLAQLNSHQLNKDNLSKVLTFLLTHQWYQGRAIRQLGVKSKNHFSAQTSIKRWKWALSNQKLDWISRKITEPSMHKELKSLIPELTGDDLTYRDWSEGGTYNMLTLDHGRYYVEHCLNTFTQYYPLAAALAHTFRSTSLIANSLGYKDTTVSIIMPRVLQGYSVDNLKTCNKTWAKSTIQRIYDSVVYHFSEVYRQQLYRAHILKDTTLENIINECGLPRSPENFDRFRVVIWEWLQRCDIDETERLLSECAPAVSWNTFKLQIDTQKKISDQQYSLPPSVQDYLAMGLRKPSSIRQANDSYPRQLIELVKKAGLTCIVALTGWRKSEFGFPMSAINRFRNNDILDGYSFPWRYQVDWYVYKTHGKVRQHREITFSTISLAERLMHLVGANIDQPCLYEVLPITRDAFRSDFKVDAAVGALWEHYVQHYSGFKMLNEWESWRILAQTESSGKLLTLGQLREKERLLRVRTTEEWNQLSIDGNLKEAWRRTHAEWPKVEFLLKGRNSNDKRNWLIRYRNGSLRSDWSHLLDCHLSKETRDWIRSLCDEHCNSSRVAASITKEMLGDALYPTPHAFRHMWAEAVYRRFDGDAGWMIRSQFKHISRSMWLAYIRDKDNRRGHQHVKQQVISSLLNNYLAKGGHGYAGQLHVYLRRLSRNTRVQTPEEQAQFLERIATEEIEDIKANPWGYCLLKRRTRSKAKCAEFGEPKRHNASPNLCLGCVHNLMQSTNVDWILLHISSHIEALQNPVVPVILKVPSFELVKNATRHVRTLDPDHEALPELQKVLDSYRAKQAEAP